MQKFLEIMIIIYIVMMLCIAISMHYDNKVLKAENQHLKDQSELIQTIKNEQCDLLPEPVKVGE